MPGKIIIAEYGGKIVQVQNVCVSMPEKVTVAEYGG